MIYGYVRVSAKDQNEDRQMMALKEYGVPYEQIILEKQSGKDFERRNYKMLIGKLKKDDLFVIKSIDRLGRNYEEIIKQWQHITKDIGADISVIDMPLLDTRTNKDFLGTFISDLVLQILSFVSQNERENIKQRQAEGIAAAKARGVIFGRPQIFFCDNYIGILRQYKKREITSKEAMELIGCGYCTFYKLLNEAKESGKLAV